jgi:rod shape-determining protein MreC
LFSSGFKRALIILAVVAIFCLGLARLVPNFAGSPVVGKIHEVLAPVQSRVMMAWSGSASLLSYFAGIRRIQGENSQLQQQVMDLTWENNRLHEYVYESQQLQKLLDFKNRNVMRFTLLGARVVSRSPSDWYSTLVVDRGSEDGVEKDMAVVSDAGLVGRVDAVWPHTADILLLLDEEGAAGAMISESGTQGVIEGSKDDPGMLQMIDLPYDAKPVAGQTVMTSGLGGIFPGDIPIGKVLKFDTGGSGLDQYALVQPDVDFDRIEDVFIITASRSVPEPVASPPAQAAQPAPAQTQPAATSTQPAQTQPAAQPTKQAPAQPQPAPAQTQPAPTSTQPAPTQPAPTSTQPAPTQPAPTSTQPAQTQPAPAQTQPAPTSTQPAPTQPVATSMTAPTRWAPPSQSITQTQWSNQGQWTDQTQ